MYKLRLLAITTFSLFFYSNHVLAQSTAINISEVPAQNLSLQDHLPVDSLSYYPYCTISISVFNFDKLNKKEFRSQSSRLQSFALNAGIQGKSICADQLNVPVFVVNYEKDKYTQITHQQGVLINKLLINKDGQDYPMISIFPKTIERNKSACYIDALKQVAVLLKNSATLNVVASVSNITDAFSQYINGISTEEESDYEWSFPAIPATDLTRTYKVDMFIIKPNGNTYTAQNFYISNGEAYSVSSGNKYTKYPYILVTTSFSSYLADEKLPSTLAIESLDELTLDKSKIKLYSDMGRISKEQFDAEAQLLDKYESYLKIKNMVSLLPKYADNEDIKTQALDEWMAYRKLDCPADHFSGNTVFNDQNHRLDNFTDNLASQIGFHKTLKEFMDTYFSSSCNVDPNAELATFYRYHDMFAPSTFIRNSVTFKNLNARISELESIVYQNNYALNIETLKKTLQSRELSDKEKLQNGRMAYNTLYTSLMNNNCRTCNDSIFNLLAMYDQIDNNKEAMSRTQDLINCTKEIDELMGCEGKIEADMKTTNINPEKKQLLLSEKEQFEKEADSISHEKSIFMSMPLQPKNEFKAEKLKVESTLDDAVKLIEEEKSKSQI